MGVELRAGTAGSEVQRWAPTGRAPTAWSSQPFEGWRAFLRHLHLVSDRPINQGVPVTESRSARGSALWALG